MTIIDRSQYKYTLVSSRRRGKTTKRQDIDMSNIKQRQKIERAVISVVAGNIFAAGHKIKVTPHGDWDSVGETEFHTAVTDEFLSDSMCCDEIDWDVYYDTGEHCSGVLLVFGNSGYDVIADHGARMTPYMPNNEQAEKFEAMAMEHGL